MDEKRGQTSQKKSNGLDINTIPVKYDRKLWISVGAHCFAEKWSNKRITWSVLLGRISEPIRTSESFEKYKAMTRARQNKAKDHGGFVGGALKDGKRSRRTVSSRSILAFDMDQADPEFWESFKLLTSCAAAVYSTHKHSPENPRLRVLIPLNRDITSDEYQAAARMFASNFDMLEQLDPKTFEPERLMYWPTCSADGEFLFDYIDAPFLDPDAILNQYPDWRDVSLWPTAPGEAKARRSAAEKQQDPTGKDGIVGAFCRVYDVPAAIETFLSDVYTPTTNEDRYTFAAGSTAAGLVIYDEGLFAFSNHGTDPASGQLCNAFDLVRIHKFGDLDKDAKEGTPVNKLPSYKAMIAWIDDELPDVCEETRRSLADFDDEEEDESAGSETDTSEENEDAAEKNRKQVRRILKKTGGKIERSGINVETVFLKDKSLRKCARKNLLSGLIEVNPDSPPPWPRNSDLSWKDSDDSQLRSYLTHNYAEFKTQTIWDQKIILAERCAFHPIKDYLEALPAWDLVPRVDDLLIRYLGAEDSIYTRQATSATIRAAIKRIYEPGCKFDTIIVLVGRPGVGKSMLIAKLGQEWFSDNLSIEDMKDKTGAEKLQGYWILEISEMKGMRKTDVESSKAFISRQDDIYRAAYGRNTERHPRQCIIIGTTNATTGFLRDVSGNRRFWPIEVSGASDLHPWDLSQDDINQIWAEALARYRNGERDLLLSPEAEQIAKARQRDAFESDEREGLVSEYLDRLIPEENIWRKMSTDRRIEWLDGDSFYGDEDIKGTRRRKAVSSMEIFMECFRNTRQSDLRGQPAAEIASIMASLGWERSAKTTRIPIYGPVRLFLRPSDDVTEV